MDKTDEQLLRISFMVSEHGKDLATVTQELKALNSQVNVGTNSLVVRIKLTEDDVRNLMRLIKTNERLVTEAELEKIKKSATVTSGIWAVAGMVVVGLLSNLPEIIAALKTILGK